MNIREQLDLLELPESERAVAEQFIRHAESKRVRVGLFGSFSVGKSELINRLIKREGLLPTHTNETTAVVTYIVHSEDEGALLTLTDGSVKPIELSELGRFVAGGGIEKIVQILVRVRMPEGLQSFEFIDTPGRNTKYQAHLEASKQALIEADATVYVFPWQGITTEDIVYLKDLMLYQPHLYFVLNKVDRIEEGQGQTIEDVRRKIEHDLREQLGQPFHVWAVSAKTGYQFDAISNELIAQLTGNTEELKRTRFHYVLERLIQKHEFHLHNLLHIQELASSKNSLVIEEEIREIELNEQKLQDRIGSELASTKRVLISLQSDFNEQVHAAVKLAIQRLEAKLSPMLRDVNVMTIQHLIDSERLEVRNTLYKGFSERLSHVMKDRLHHSLSEIKGSDFQFQFSEPSLEELQAMYEERLQKLAEEYRIKKQQADLIQVEGSHREEELGSLVSSLVELENQLMEEYVPRYVEDENFDREKFTKVLGYVGKAGDIVLGIAAAVMTAGASAAAQAAGKAGAEVAKHAGKEVVKAVGKETIVGVGKEAAKEVGKQITKEVSKEVAKQVAKETGKQVFKQYALETIKVVGAMVSPVETVAENIGKMIDSSRSQEQILDTFHRHQFLIARQKLEEKYDAMKSEIETIRLSQKANESISRSAAQKLLELDGRYQEELKGLEQEVKRDQEVLRQKELAESLKCQLQEFAVYEKERYVEWAKYELERVQLMLEQTLPAYYEEELAEWKERLALAKDKQTAGQNALADSKMTILALIRHCQELREWLQHAS